jgi:methionyl-tRNA formyltransferase
LRSPFKNAVFLGYDSGRAEIIGLIEKAGFAVTQTAEPVIDLSPFDLAVSFGYRHILRKEVLKTARRPVLNLHISYLPFNRGAHPNFWSWVEGTPAGVTIHEIDEGIDTGPIVAQSKLDDIDPATTLRESHALLVCEVEKLFEYNARNILSGAYSARPQIGDGSYHAARDLPDWTDWDMKIADAISEYRRRA